MKARILDAARPAACHPLTVDRDLGDCPVANRPLRQAQREELERAGLELVEDPAAPALELHGDAWIPAEALAEALDSGAARLCDAEGDEVARLSEADDAAPAHQVEEAFRIRYAWDLLRVNELLIDQLDGNEIQGDLHPSTVIEGCVHIGEGTRLLPGVYIEGNVMIGANCKVGPNCYLRGRTAVGDGCHVGQAVEIKNSILDAGVNVGHLSYVGDSILASGTNFGAGTITANLRHDGRNHRSAAEGRLVDTGRRKLGAIVGADVHTGIHTSIYPGRKLWPHRSTRPGEVVEKDLD